MKKDFEYFLQQNTFKQNTFSVEEIGNLYKKKFPNSKNSDFFWALHFLKIEKIIIKVSENLYYIRKKNSYDVSPLMLSLYEFLGKKFDLGYVCIWTSDWYNQFSNHQIIHNFIVIEIEKESTESVFETLKLHGFKDVFLLQNKKDEEILLNRYILETYQPIIVRKMISKAPIQIFEYDAIKIQVPHLEKMLVDLFTEDYLLMSYPNSEKLIIFENVLNDYVIDFKKMFAYARRRGNEEELQQYLFENFGDVICKT